MSDCCGGTVKDQVMLLACSGGSNVGQLANAAAIRLEEQGVGMMFCAVGVAAGIDKLVGVTKDKAVRVAIDGCPVACARVGLEKQGITPEASIVLTDLGIEKKHAFDISEEQIAACVQGTRKVMGLGNGCCG